MEKPRNISVFEGESATFSCHTHLSLRQYTSWVRIFQNEEQIVELAEGKEAFTLENVTRNDTGIYACVVGNNEAHFQEVAHLEVKEIGNMIPMSIGSSYRLGKVEWAIILISIAFLIILILGLHYRYRQEHKKKKQVMENAKSITQWTKKIIIDRQDNYDTETIIAPTIRIEKQVKTS